MKTKEVHTEEMILSAAYKNFLLYGYHGTRLQQIATVAGVNKSVIHYYFRSKERLYVKVVEKVIDLLVCTNFEVNSNQEEFEKLRWFLFTELYNNITLLEKALKELNPNDWGGNIKDIKNWLDFEPITLHIH